MDISSFWGCSVKQALATRPNVLLVLAIMSKHWQKWDAFKKKKKKCINRNTHSVYRLCSPLGTPEEERSSSLIQWFQLSGFLQKAWPAILTASPRACNKEGCWPSKERIFTLLLQTEIQMTYFPAKSLKSTDHFSTSRKLKHFPEKNKANPGEHFHAFPLKQSSFFCTHHHLPIAHYITTCNQQVLVITISWLQPECCIRKHYTARGRWHRTLPWGWSKSMHVFSSRKKSIDLTAALDVSQTIQLHLSFLWPSPHLPSHTCMQTCVSHLFRWT